MGHEHDRDPMDINPYADQTVANTDTPWLGTGTPVDVDLTGLREYAKHMVDQQTDLMGRAMHLQHLHDMPGQAWHGAVLGEARYVQSQVSANAKELSLYLQNLGNTLMNIGHAAQTVADAYNSADGTSAASLNAVLFAFADPNAERPSGLPSHIGQTYSEWMLANANTAPLAADSPEWGRSTETTSPYQTTRTSYAPNGQVRTVVTTNVPGSGMTVVTTTVYGPRGAVLSTGSTRTTSGYNSATNTQSSVVETTTGGNRTGRTETTTTYDNDGEVTREETRTYATDPQGNDRHTTTRTETVDEDKVRTETTSRPGATPGAAPVVTDEVVIGPETEGMTRPQDPLDHAANPMAPGNR